MFFIITNLELPEDKNELTIRCGSCRKCIDACPTDAIVDDGVIDSRKCISYLTIENRGPIPEEYRRGIGNWLFGCDICQEVCPHNLRAETVKADEFLAIRIAGRQLKIRDILEIASDEDFLEQFKGTPLMRAKRRGLQRNACVVAGNSGDKSMIDVLKAFIDQTEDSMLIEHAEWALSELD